MGERSDKTPALRRIPFYLAVLDVAAISLSGEKAGFSLITCVGTNKKMPCKVKKKCQFPYRSKSRVICSLFQALGLWGKSEKAGERGKDERGRRRAKEREPVRISLTALCRYSRSCYTL